MQHAPRPALRASGGLPPQAAGTPGACLQPDQVACRAVLDMLKTGLRPSDIMTKAAFCNAITLVMTLGGSTNAVLHFLAIARAVGVELTLDDFQASHRLLCSCMLTPVRGPPGAAGRG